MLSSLMNAMRLQAQKASAGDAVSRVGVVTSYDPATYMARVTLQPDSVLTGWLPIKGLWVGNGWGLYAPPSINNLCTIVFGEGDINGGYVDGVFWNSDGDAPDTPLSVDAGEFWAQHKNGAFFKLTNDGKATFSDGQGAQIQFDGSGKIISGATKWTHTGAMDLNGTTIDTSGNVHSPGTVTGDTDVQTGTVTLKTHTHADPQGGTVGPPTG